MTHPLEARGWTLKPVYYMGGHLYGGRHWHDLSGVPRFHENSFVARVIEGKEDNPPRVKDAGKREAAGDAQARNGLQR